MKAIDKEKLIYNVNQMINVLEYDAMRSAGKARVNAPTLVDLYTLKDRYEGIKVTDTPKVEEPVVPVKKGPGRPPKV